MLTMEGDFVALIRSFQGNYSIVCAAMWSSNWLLQSSIVSGPDGVKDIGSPHVSSSHTGNLLSPMGSFPSCPNLLQGTLPAIKARC